MIAARASRGTGWARFAFLALAYLSACGCSCQPNEPIEAADSTSRPIGEVPTRPQPARGQPKPVGDELEQVRRIARLAAADGKVRVMIRLEGVVPPIEAPTYDKRAKRSDIRATVDKTRIQQVATAQQQFLSQFEGGDNRRVTRFEHAPYLAMDLSAADLTKLASWVEQIPPLSTERPFRIWIEPTDELKTQSSPPTLAQVTVEEASVHMEFGGFTASASPATVVVIDERVDDALHLLHGRVDALEEVGIGPAVEIPSSPSALDPASYSLSHGTKVALVVAMAAPSARIIALDVTGASGTSSTEYVANALQRVLSKWSQEPGREIAAVCVSLGDENMTSRDDCDCDSEPVYVGCAVLKPAIRDHINLLAQAQIPVVIAAGNHALYEGDVFYPSCLSSAVTVGATSGGVGGLPVERGGFSNWGPMLDLCASGHDLVLKLDQWIEPPTMRLPYSFGSGTSFSVPFVAAGFALLYDQHPDATSALVDEALRATGSAVTSGANVSVPEIRLLSASKWLESPPEPIPPLDSDPPAPTPAPDPAVSGPTPR